MAVPVFAVLGGPPNGRAQPLHWKTRQNMAQSDGWSASLAFACIHVLLHCSELFLELFFSDSQSLCVYLVLCVCRVRVPSAGCRGGGGGIEDRQGGPTAGLVVGCGPFAGRGFWGGGFVFVCCFGGGACVWGRMGRRGL
ncbi:unnamed protein product [Dicrocoelium dendriticum]|nr:unnamed protein product [Dicrocoelium dendriticum]